MSSIAPRPRVTGIHSIALRVPCYAEAIAFYRDVWLLEDMGERDDSHAFRTACADPDNLLMSNGARRTLSRIMVLWGLTSASMLFVDSAY